MGTKLDGERCHTGHKRRATHRYTNDIGAEDVAVINTVCKRIGRSTVSYHNDDDSGASVGSAVSNKAVRVYFHTCVGRFENNAARISTAGEVP